MFAPADLDKDPALLLELKEDVRGECETMGQVTSCTLFDVSA
jgi:HIV Tat-specific factor 1